MNLLLFKQEEIESSRVTVTGRRFRHAIEWLKVKPGASIRCGVLNGKLGDGIVVDATSDRLDLQLNLTEEPPTPRPLTLILALPRPKVFGRILQAVTSLGIKRVEICHSYQVEKAYWSAHQLSPEWVNHQILLGLEQSIDTLWPTITFHRRLRPFVEDELKEITKGHDCWIAHPRSRKKVPHNNPQPAALAIGPEGGWIPFEIELFQAQGFTAGHFGPHILKCDTAIAAMIGHMT